MKQLVLCFLAGLALSGCSPTQQGAGMGAATGAVVGGAIRNDVRGAAVGAAIGGAGGAMIGHVVGQPGQCQFRDRNTGRQYVAPCPS
ncbi:glycine zipper domain-containing protein [Rhizobium sp. BK251]|uniref:YMGG-like glycine zipper-containing protein n=1 Tax=Rhizobium sp. BK251 TaxID=2512125 RepID=UPI00104286EA|nr:glycine zipper domain-containing protein [Rhizobium sp. BK251]